MHAAVFENNDSPPTTLLSVAPEAATLSRSQPLQRSRKLAAQRRSLPSPSPMR